MTQSGAKQVQKVLAPVLCKNNPFSMLLASESRTGESAGAPTSLLAPGAATRPRPAFPLCVLGRDHLTCEVFRGWICVLVN